MNNTGTFKPMLATTHKGQDPKGKLVSEKFDGIRFIWDGLQFISKEGNKLNVPLSIVEAMPAGIKLDGEIYGGLGTIQETAGKVKKGDFSGLEFIIFDVIAPGDYDTRISLINLSELPSVFRIIEQTECKGQDHLDSFVDAIIEKGGEGAVLRDPSAEYKSGRVNSVLKVKRFQSAEATVIGHVKSGGKLKSILVEWHGAQFKLASGLNDESRENPTALGALVTFSYCGLTEAGKPKCTSFICERNYE